MVPVSPELPMQRDPKALEAGLNHDSAKLENTVFPLPPSEAVSQRSATPGSIIETSVGSHSRDGSVMSSASTTPLVTPVPILRVPQPPPRIARKPAPTSAGLVSILKKDVRFNPVAEGIDTNQPSRPITRPPTMDFGDLDPP